LKTNNHINSFKVRVRYADVDKMGFAYYAHYLRWFEIGRSELLRELGLVYVEIEEAGVFYPVTESYIKYITPARYDELIEIRTKFDYIKKASLKLYYEIVCAENSELHAKGYTVHAAMDKGGKIVRVSDKLLNLLGSKI
jgi:acyl-CoA thioester hydrolase